jgi:AraC-like DNA-binding protein
MPAPPTTADVRPPTKILSAAASGSVELFRRYNGDVDAIFGHAGISVRDLESPLNELNLAQYCAMFEEAARQTGHDNIGLDFGHDFHPKRLGMLGFAALSSPTLAAALRNLVTYFPAHQGSTTFGMVQDCDILWLHYRIHDPRIEKRRQDAELSLGMFCNVFRAALGPDWAPLEVRFEHARPDGAEAHERCFGAPVHFGRRTNAIAFRRSDLNVQMPERDPYLFAVVRPFLESRCRAAADTEAFAARLREELKLLLRNGLPTLSDTARHMGLSETALQRLLREKGLSFADVLRAARQELALHYLNESDLSLTEIALSLGYSELSAFSRAFRSWTGMNPQRFRRTAQRGRGIGAEQTLRQDQSLPPQDDGVRRLA